MNVELFKEKLISKTASSFSWNENNESNNEVVYLDAEIETDVYNNIFDLYVSYFDDGVVVIKFVLFNLDKNESVLKLTNNLTRESMFMNAYVIEKQGHYNLHLRGAAHKNNEDEAVDYILDMIDLFTSDDIKDSLKPLDIIAG